jgi:hypothetical protein
MDTKRLMAGALAGFLMIGASARAWATPPPSGGNGARQAPANGATSSSTLKVKSFSALGTGVYGNGFTGTCFGEVCNASSGNCFCEQFSGTTKAPILGQSTWTVDFTTNEDDVTPTGNGGYCFPSEGELTISSAKGDIRAEVSGPVCQNFLGSSISTYVFQYGQAFSIDPALSDGSAAGLNGGGTFSLSANASNNYNGITTMSADGFSAK